MGGITSGVGLASGIDSANLINQLLAIEARPRVLAEQRVLELQQQQGSWLAINSSLSALRSSASGFRTSSVFGQFTATSSNESALSANATTAATSGTYSFLVDRLVSTEQRLSRGFADTDRTGLNASGFSFESAAGSVSTSTRLSELNGGEGIDRGTFRITDKAGTTKEIDLSRAVTVDDVLEAVNSEGDLGVTLRVVGDGFVLEDTTGGAGTLRVEDESGSTTAESLGLLGTASGGNTTITGTGVRTIAATTALSVLNDGNGVQILDKSTDFTIRSRNNTTLNIDLGAQTETTTDGEGVETTEIVRTRASTLQDVIDIINEQSVDAGANIAASLSNDGTSIVINDTSTGVDITENLAIQSASGRTTAEDLGIATDAPDVDPPAGVVGATVDGQRLVAGINSVLTRSLNGGNGLGDGEFIFTDRAGNDTAITLSAASANGSLSEVIDELNAGLTGAGVGITVGLNDAGNGLSLTDTSGGLGQLVVKGDGATNAGLATSGVLSNEFQGASAQKKWVGLATRISDLNNGTGLGSGRFTITDAAGEQATVNLNSDTETVADLLSLLNSRPNVSIEARLNDTGDGILITDTSGGGGQLVIEDESGAVADRLNIAGTFEDEGSGIGVDGTYDRTVGFEATDTLDDILRKINEAGVGVVATIINDGSPSSPFRLSLTSRESGESGRVLIDTQGFDLGLETLSEGEDAVVFFGSGDPKDAVLITSSTNSLDNVARGLTIGLNNVSDERIDVVVGRNRDVITENINTFVESFNSVINQIDAQSFFDREAERGGPLTGDSTARRIRRELINAVQSPVQGFDNRFRFLFEIGIRISGSGDGQGNSIEFDQAKFDQAYAEDPEAVEQLFEAFTQEAREDVEISPGITTPDVGPDRFGELGVMEQIRLLVDSYTSSIDGVITRRTQNLDTRIDLQSGRIESFNEQLDRKRDKLSREFANLELAIASLQNQQQALGSIQSIGPVSF